MQRVLVCGVLAVFSLGLLGCTDSEDPSDAGVDVSAAPTAQVILVPNATATMPANVPAASPAASPAPTGSPAPSASPTAAATSAAATATRPPSTPASGPTATPAPPAATPAPTQPPAAGATSSLRIVSITSPIAKGGTARLDAAAPPNTSCTIAYRTPSGDNSNASGLGDKTTDATGNVSWSWTVAANTSSGSGNVRVTCAGQTSNATLIVN